MENCFPFFMNRKVHKTEKHNKSMCIIQKGIYRSNIVTWNFEMIFKKERKYFYNHVLELNEKYNGREMERKVFSILRKICQEFNVFRLFVQYHRKIGGFQRMSKTLEKSFF